MMQEFIGEMINVHAIHFSDDGSEVVVSFEDGTLAVHDAQTGVEREIRK